MFYRNPNYNNINGTLYPSNNSFIQPAPAPILVNPPIASTVVTPTPPNIIQQNPPPVFPNEVAFNGFGASRTYLQKVDNYNLGTTNVMPVPPPPGAPLTWMNRPPPILGVPLGLEYLTLLDALNVYHLPNFQEMYTGWQASNRFQISNANGQQVYFAFETTDGCMRCCCGSRRGCIINVVDNLNQEVMRMTREFRCMACHCWYASCCDCCAKEIQVEAPVGEIAGYIRQRSNCWKPRYEVLDQNHRLILMIKGPCCFCRGNCCGCDKTFSITGADGRFEIGAIRKQWTGYVRTLFTNAECFSLTFPIDMSVKVKACLLGALFLMNFVYFEKRSCSCK